MSSREKPRRLREIVGAEREELGVARDLAGHEASAGQLDHRADAEGAPGREALVGRHAKHQLARLLELVRVGHQRDHDLDARRPAGALADGSAVALKMARTCIS